MFAYDDFFPIAKQLQAAVESKDGRGAVVTSTLRTVENTYWGVKKGIVVNVTWVYLSRSKSWESRLSPEMRKVVVPENGDDTISSGVFKDFPNYATTPADLSNERARLLFDLTEFVVVSNEEIFRDALS